MNIILRLSGRILILHIFIPEIEPSLCNETILLLNKNLELELLDSYSIRYEKVELMLMYMGG